MPQFNQVHPRYMPENCDDTRQELEAYLVLALRQAIASIRTEALTTTQHSDNNVYGIQFLCRELDNKIVLGQVVALDDVNNEVAQIATLEDVREGSFAESAIAELNAIYTAHCENIKRVNAVVSQQASMQASGPIVSLYGDLLADPGISDAPKPLVFPQPPTQSGARGETATYGALGEQAHALSADDPSLNLVSGRQMLSIIDAIEKEVTPLAEAALDKDDYSLMGILGLCMQLRAQVEKAIPITPALIIAEVARIDTLKDHGGASLVQTYIERLKAAAVVKVESVSPAQAAPAAASKPMDQRRWGAFAITKDAFVAKLDAYIAERAKVKTPSGKVQEYLHLSFLGKMNQASQNSYSDEVRAVNAIKAVLSGNGSAADLQGCLHTLRHGRLGDMLRGSAKRQELNGIADRSVSTVSEFVSALAAQAPQYQNTPK